jgi:Tfp pilus assembly protein PilO
MSRLNERLARLPHWQIDAVGLGVCILLGALWYEVGFTPLASARAERAALTQDLEAKREDAGHFQKLIQAHESAQTKLREQIRAGAVTLQKPDHLLQRLQELSAAAHDAGLDVGEIKPGDPAPEARFTTVPIHLSGTGRYKAFALFLHGLRSKFPDTALLSLELRGEPEMSEKPARFGFDLVWFAAPTAPAAKAAPPAPVPKK